MRLTFRSGISSLILVLIILLIMFPGCSKPDNQGAADEGDGKYFNLTYEDNDAGFYNPARLARAVPKSIPGFKLEDTTMRYTRLREFHGSEIEKHIIKSHFIADYININSNNSVYIRITDNKSPYDEEEYPDTITINGHVFGKGPSSWYYISGMISIGLANADKSEAQALGSALDWEYIDNGFK